nr:hypothetical protein [Tanacetum cinerariifolium]
EDYQGYGLAIPEVMLNDAIKQSESYQMFIKYSTGQISPKKSRDKGTQRNKTDDESQETVDVSKYFKPEPKPKPVKRKTASRRMVKKKVTISTNDNIIFDDPDVTLELGKSISKTEAEEAEAARQVHVTHARIVIKSVLEPTRRRKSGKVTSDPPKKLKGVPSLTLEEQEAVDTMQALKESRKTSRRQPGTEGSNEGTSTIPGVPNESIVVSATLSKGTDTKPGVPDEENVISEEKVILEWGSEQESEYSKEDQLGDKEKDDKDDDVDDEGDDYISDNQDADDADAETESDEDEIYKYKIRMRKDEDVEMSNDEVKDFEKRNKLRRKKTPNFTIKSTNKAALNDFDQKSALYQTMHANKSFNRNISYHKLYHALMEALIEDENAMDKGVANTIKDHKRKHDDDEEDPPFGPNQGKKTKRRITNESKSSKKPSTTKEIPKGKAPSKGSKTGKSASAKEPVEEPTVEMVMDDAGEDVTCLIGIILKEIVTPFDLSKPLPLQERTYTTSITKTKAARYEIKGIEDMVPMLWSPTKVSDIVDFIVALRMFTRSLVIKKHVEDLQLGVESYQKKLNITPPQQTFPEIEFKELYTPSYKPLRIIYEYLTKQKRVMRADELYKFSDGTLKKVRDELHNRIRDFCLEYNKEMARRKWTAIDRKMSEFMAELIDKHLRKRRIIRNLKRLVGAWEIEMDYKLITHTR